MNATMHDCRTWIALSAAILGLVGGGTCVASAKDLCSTAPSMRCAKTGCAADVLADPGNAVEPKTGRRFFLDYPCDLKPGQKVVFVLALHGGGFGGNWMRHYFPMMDYKDKYRLVIATPTGSRGAWVPALDDAYLRNVVAQVEARFGRDAIRGFWLAGHSLGGQTANRLIVEDPFFTSRVTGWISLSGGRLGSKRADVRAAIPAGSSSQPPMPGQAPQMPADASVLPGQPFDFIYETGEHELTPAGLPGTSKWAAKLGCKARVGPRSIVDTRPGLVYDMAPNPHRNPIWGRAARPGSAQVFVYPGCPDGRIVADIVRLDKGHTEGIEPQITEEIVRLVANSN